MQTVYIDVYFLINFTVDLLALHFASSFSRVPIKNFNLILASVIGGAYAIVALLIPPAPLLQFAVAVIALIVFSAAARWSLTPMRRIKLTCAFLLFLVIIGGLVYFAFNMLERYLPDYSEQPIRNRRLLILAIIILLVMAAIKLCLSLFSHTATQKCERVCIEHGDSSIEVEALVDTGNLLKDPMSGSPVILIKRDCAEGLFPHGVPTLYATEQTEEIKKSIRIIPIKRGERSVLLVGIKPDRVWICRGKQKSDIDITVAIDNEGGSFGGFMGLIPAIATENA